MHASRRSVEAIGADQYTIVRFAPGIMIGVFAEQEQH
jgi:hypothetical protein